ncbi:thioredoxin domain-containing protein [Corynebacterium sp. ES2794-CONJ1]|uniref:DsbA family protein n=1 Tax=unclassified Corynebacterium TaxID=2624378 RepID=UPI00216B32D4|nr:MULTISPECIES: thioredoxin domain-containing protein [unclassified Corynebacterium]MCS4531667.1 thioredoxin domain-containing protein [Corynebacterium sp. ES2730-CONJ]MCU9519063.1 thioredoxin domain-containing protein [Corynebacterium sp. ES2794-CONJ1]
MATPIHPPAKQSAFASVSPAIWALVITLIAVAGLAGYALGYNKGSSEPAIAPAETISTTAAAPTSVDPNPATEAAPAGAEVSPGSQAIAPNTDSATIDATMYGPGAEVKRAEDIMNVHRRNPADPFAIGALDAPVVISEFSDLECPFCARHANETHPKIMQEYVNKGLVRIEWNDFPINGDHSIAAAKAARAAAAQGKFHEFLAALFTASQSVPGHPHNTIENFMDFARQAGVPDLDKFKQEAMDATFDEAVDQARSYGASLGITGTPGFVIGGQFVNGAQPFEIFKQVIDAELEKAKN